MRGAVATGCIAAIVAALSELPRLAVAADVLPAALRPFTWSDLLATYVQRGIEGGRLPYFDVAFEYPPVVGYLGGAFALAASSRAAYLAMWAVVVVLASGALGIVLAREAGPRAALRWALSPQLLLYAGLGVDVVPAALLAGAAIAARHGRVVGSASALALGAATKLFPSVALPALALRARRGGRSALLAFVIVGAALFVPALIAPHSALGGLVYYTEGYPAAGVAVWGLVATTLGAAGLPGTTIVLAATTAGLLGTLVLRVYPASRRADATTTFALSTIAVLFWSRLYSPQFSLWLIPFFALTPLGGRTFALLSLADVAVFLTASPLTLVRWDAPEGLPSVLLALLASAVVLRHVALIRAWRDLWARA